MGEHGIRALLPELGRIDLAVVGEPTGMQAAAGERGLVVLDCTAHGRSGHAARGEGINALYIALEDIARLRGFRFARESALLGPIGLAVTQIEAGTQHNVVPDTCRFVVDIRTTDAYTNEETVELLRAAIRSEAIPRSTRIRAVALDDAHPPDAGRTGRGTHRIRLADDLRPHADALPGPQDGPGRVVSVARRRRIHPPGGDRGRNCRLHGLHRTFSERIWLENFGTRASSPTR